MWMLVIPLTIVSVALVICAFSKCSKKSTASFVELDNVDPRNNAATKYHWIQDQTTGIWYAFTANIKQAGAERAAKNMEDLNGHL